MAGGSTRRRIDDASTSIWQPPSSSTQAAVTPRSPSEYGDAQKRVRVAQGLPARGRDAIASAEHGGQQPYLDPQRVAAFDEGPAAHGYGYDDNQRWTLARIRDLIAEMFGSAVKGREHSLAAAVHSWQAPTRRATERDEENAPHSGSVSRSYDCSVP